MRPTQIRDIKKDEYEKYLKKLEEGLNTGPYSRSFVENDLQTRKTMDSYSTMGSSGRQTYELSAKKRVYEQTFDSWISTIDDYMKYLSGMFLAQQQQYQQLKTLSEKVRQQIEYLRSFVRGY